MKYPVVFRKLNSGAVIALLPTLPLEGNALETACKGFTASGEVSADIGLMRITREAKEGEFYSLWAKMAQAGYDVEPVKRITGAINEQRLQAAAIQESVAMAA